MFETLKYKFALGKANYTIKREAKLYGKYAKSVIARKTGTYPNNICGRFAEAADHLRLRVGKVK